MMVNDEELSENDEEYDENLQHYEVNKDHKIFLSQNIIMNRLKLVLNILNNFREITKLKRINWLTKINVKIINVNFAITLLIGYGQRKDMKKLILKIRNCQIQRIVNFVRNFLNHTVT